MEIQRITPEQTHQLRQKVLRPHQVVEEMVYPLDQEPGSFHLGVLREGVVLGIISVYPESTEGHLNSGSWRIRGMAVEPDLQGQGLGKMLVHQAIENLTELKAQEVW